MARDEASTEKIRFQKFPRGNCPGARDRGEMKRFLLAAICCLPLADADPLRTATVDMQELFKQYHKTNEAQKLVNIDRTRIQKDNNERVLRIRELETRLNDLRKRLEDPTVNDAKKQTLLKEWQLGQQEGLALERERSEFYQRRHQALNERMVEQMKGILGEIRKMIEEQAKKDGYDYVFDKSGLSTSQVPILLYTKDATDITASLVKDLNKDAPAAPSPAPGGEIEKP